MLDFWAEKPKYPATRPTDLAQADLRDNLLSHFGKVVYVNQLAARISLELAAHKVQSRPWLRARVRGPFLIFSRVGVVEP